MILVWSGRIGICARLAQVSKVVGTCADVRLCHSLKRFPHSLLEPKTSSSFIQWKRNVLASNFFCQKGQFSKPDLKTGNFAVSHPRLHKQYARDQMVDGLSREWDLVFSTTSQETKMTIVIWITFIVILLVPILAVYGWWEYEHEENVIFAGFEINKTTEVLMFCLFNFLMCGFINRIVRALPKRIYYNSNSDKYLVLRRTVFPWKVLRLECKPSEIKDLPMKKTFQNLTPWKKHEYLVQNKVCVLPPSCFRSGHDRDWFLRNVH